MCYILFPSEEEKAEAQEWTEAPPDPEEPKDVSGEEWVVITTFDMCSTSDRVYHYTKK